MGELDFNVLLTAQCHFRTSVGEREREADRQTELERDHSVIVYVHKPTTSK